MTDMTPREALEVVHDLRILAQPHMTVGDHERVTRAIATLSALADRAGELAAPTLDESLVRTLLEMANDGGVCPTPGPIMAELAEAWLSIYVGSAAAPGASHD